MNVGMLLLSLILTLLGYCLFPLIYANCRNEPITAKKYKGLCWGFNLIPMCIFIAINPSNGAAYLLWTAIFTSLGVKKLRSKELLLENDESQSTNDDIDESNDTEYEDKCENDKCEDEK